MAVALARDLAVNVGFNPTRALIADVTSDGPERARGYSWMQAISGSFGVLAYAIGALFGNIVLIYAAVGIVLVLAIGPPFLIAEPRALAAATPRLVEHRSGYESGGTCIYQWGPYPEKK